MGWVYNVLSIQAFANVLGFLEIAIAIMIALRPQRALVHPLLTLVWNTVVEDVLGETTVEGIGLRHIETGEMSILPIQGLFVAIGQQHNTDVFKGRVDMEGLGYIRTRPGSTYTSINGVFAARDVQDQVYRQAVTAVGSGAMATILAP
jgi:thioredoxin reductase (NADPH)